MIRWIINFCVLFFGVISVFAQSAPLLKVHEIPVTVGASRLSDYLPSLKNKRVAIVGNQTSMVQHTHLVDTLISLGVSIDKIFCPEHGFRGEAEAGAKISSSIDTKTGIPIVSLYGNNKKPTKDNLKGIQLVIFDIQDVGARFYTYLSTLHYVMEACAELNVPLLLLDRPNPNGFFIDGPVLKPNCKSFVGMHPVPISYGMTIGEYAKMINGEKWLNNGVQCNLEIVECENYTHETRYTLPVPPSPNLPTNRAIYLYPTLCLFEGTPFSIGRGTDRPFEMVGHPDNPLGDFLFTPKVIPGKSDNPPCLGKQCRGFLLSDFSNEFLKKENAIHLYWIIDLYHKFPDKKNFFTPFFDKLAGDKSVKEMIMNGKTEEDIRKTWQLELDDFKKIRAKYLLYSEN